MKMLHKHVRTDRKNECIMSEHLCFAALERTEAQEQDSKRGLKVRVKRHLKGPMKLKAP